MLTIAKEGQPEAKKRKKPEEGRLSQVGKEERQVALQLELWPLPVFLLIYILLDQV